MREKKWTKGPWVIEFDPSLSDRIIIDAEGVPEISSIEPCDYDDGKGHVLTHTDWANAHLIAAAPELVEALERMLGEFAPVSRNAAAVQARAALSKAYGEQHD